MSIPSNLPRLKGFRYPREVISYAVWAYHRFALSTADVEDLLAERGVTVSRETVRLGSVANFYYDWRCSILWTQLPNECSKLLES